MVGSGVLKPSVSPANGLPSAAGLPPPYCQISCLSQQKVLLLHPNQSVLCSIHCPTLTSFFSSSFAWRELKTILASCLWETYPCQGKGRPSGARWGLGRSEGKQASKEKGQADCGRLPCIDVSGFPLSNRFLLLVV